MKTPLHHHQRHHEDVCLKPVLLQKRQHLHRQSSRYSLFPSISPLSLWLFGLSLLTYPLWVVILHKYRVDFQDDWHHYHQNEASLFSQSPTNHHLVDAKQLVLVARGAFLKALDRLVILCIDVSPRIASSVVMLHTGICMVFYLLSYAGTSSTTKHVPVS